MQLRTMIPAFILSNGKKEREVRATKKERAGKTEVKQGREKDEKERRHVRTNALQQADAE